MRGGERRSEGMFSYIRLEDRIAADHPLRAIRALVDETLAALSSQFDDLYSHTGRPSIPPEYLLRATLLQAFFTVRSERQLMEQIDYNLLFRWFVGLSMDDAVWDHSSFSTNRDRLLEAGVAREFLLCLLALPKVKQLLSSDHFTVDGTLLKAWASMKSFQLKDGSGGGSSGSGRNGERNFRREKRSNETHESRTDPEAKLYRKGDGQESRLCYMGHVLMENRNGLAVASDVTPANGTAERTAALALINRSRSSWRRITLGADKAYDVADFVEALREQEVTAHIAIDGHVTKTGKTRKTAIDGRITRHPGYAVSQIVRKRVEEIFGWVKTTGGLAQVKLRGLAKVQAIFNFAILAYNLVRIPKLLAPAS
jgi:transposase